ncbi:hypothetical protein CEXT_173531, partial [Caerostris extrusa]
PLVVEGIVDKGSEVRGNRNKEQIDTYMGEKGGQIICAFCKEELDSLSLMKIDAELYSSSPIVCVASIRASDNQPLVEIVVSSRDGEKMGGRDSVI